MGLVLYTIPPDYNWSRNPIRYKVGTSLPLSTVGLYIQCRVSFGTMGTTPAEVIRFPLTPDSLGIVDVDMQRIVHGLLTNQLPAISATIQKIATHGGTLQVSFVEYSIDLPSGGTPMDAGTVNVLKGGIAYERWQGQAWFANWYTTPRRILSWFGTERTISTWQQLWLSYLHIGTGASNYRIKTTVYFSDGTTAAGAIVNFPSTGAVVDGYLYHIPAGYTQLAIGAVNTAKIVHYYTIGVYATDTLISELITCLMDHTPDYEQLQFVFFNSMGGLDTMRLKGEHEEQLTRDFDLVDINTSRSNMGSSVLPAQSAMNRVVEQVTYKGNIGLTDDINVQDLRRELFLSNAIYIPKDTRWWPVNVTDKTVSKGKMNAQVRELDIEWSYAWANENYTPVHISLGTEPAPDISCPVVTQGQSDTTATVSWTHSPGPIDRYRIQFYTTADVPVGSEQVFSIPFGSAITAIISGLTAVTSYKFKIFMDVTDTGYTLECSTGYTFTTAAAPPVKDGLVSIEVATNSNSSARIDSVIAGGSSVILDGGELYPVRDGDGPYTAKALSGTVTVVVLYVNMLNNVVKLTDAAGTIHTPQTVSYSGGAVFTGVVINNSVTTVIRIDG